MQEQIWQGIERERDMNKIYVRADMARDRERQRESARARGRERE